MIQLFNLYSKLCYFWINNLDPAENSKFNGIFYLLRNSVLRLYVIVSMFCEFNFSIFPFIQHPPQSQGLYNRPTRMAPPLRSQQPYHYPSASRMPRYHSEESLPSKSGGLYSSRIHSSADEISSVNRSPSELSSSDESFSR